MIIHKGGAYFVTICVNNKEPLFGNVVYGEMVLNEFGQVAQNEWEKTEQVRKNVILDSYIVMPNHIHMIFFLLDNKGVGASRRFAPSAPASVFGQRGESPLLAYTLRPVTDCNCVAARRGGEQQEVSD